MCSTTSPGQPATQRPRFKRSSSHRRIVRFIDALHHLSGAAVQEVQHGAAGGCNQILRPPRQPAVALAGQQGQASGQQHLNGGSMRDERGQCPWGSACPHVWQQPQSSTHAASALGAQAQRQSLLNARLMRQWPGAAAYICSNTRRQAAGPQINQPIHPPTNFAGHALGSSSMWNLTAIFQIFKSPSPLAVTICSNKHGCLSVGGGSKMAL